MRLWLKRHRFLLRTFLILVLVFLIGFLAAGFIISYTTAGDYVDAQSNYEYEKMSGDADKLNEKLININAAILQAYQRDENRENIATILGEKNAGEKEQKIKEFIIQAVQISPYITDIILLDTQEQQTYMQSNILSQVWDPGYDWFADDFVQEVSESTNEVIFFENHKMSGINLNREVCTFGHKLINPMEGNRDAMSGILLIQVPTKTLFEPVSGYEGRQEGKSYIIDKENHVLYTNESEISDKQAVEIYKQYGQENDSVFERYLLRSKKLISWSGFTYVNIMDKGILFRRNFVNILWNILPILCGCIAICFLAINMSVYLIGKRIDRIVDFTRIIQSGNLDEKLAVGRDDEFTAIEQGLNVMTVKLNHYIEEKYVADIALKKAQIGSLQLQMNPHFMFNTLENIRSSIISADNGKSADMISVLGDMYRWNLRKPDVVNLEDELDYLDLYMELQENRYQGRLHYIQNIPEELWNCTIPKLTLQPVVENSLNHGFTPGMEHCEISLEAQVEENGKTLSISISDNGLGMAENRVEELLQLIGNKKESNDFYHIGMRNIHQRIQLLSGEMYGLFIFSKENVGTKIMIRIPFVTDKPLTGR